MTFSEERQLITNEIVQQSYHQMERAVLCTILPNLLKRHLTKRSSGIDLLLLEEIIKSSSAKEDCTTNGPFSTSLYLEYK